MDNTKKEIIVTIVSSICVAITAILAAIITSHPVTKHEVRLISSFDNVNTTDYFPLRLGARWTYVGTARNDTENKITVEKKVRIQMRVVDIIKGGNASLIIMEGHPSDAIFALEVGDAKKSTVEVQPSRYAYVVVSNKVFQIPEDKIQKAKLALSEGGITQEPFLSGDELEFEFPLFRGQTFGDVRQIPRDDLRYAWHVTDDSTLFHELERGRISEIPEYTLEYNSLPDFTRVTFIPYTGITSFSYSHHGTTSQVAVYLEEYNGEN